MKRILAVLVLVLLLGFHVSSFGANYYADWNNGTDQAGCGTASGSSACKTLSYLVNTAQTLVAGDVANLAVGSYIDNTIVVLPLGVDVVGVGRAATVITTSVASTTQGYIDAYSATFQENASGHIFRDFTINGNSRTNETGIRVYQRDNIQVYNMRFTGSDRSGLRIVPLAYSDYDTPPTTWADNIKVHDNLFDNCGSENWNGLNYGTSAFILGPAAKGSLIYNNNIDSSNADCGDCIQLDMAGWWDSVQIYNNTLRNDPSQNPMRKFSIEAGPMQNDCKIYGNTMYDGCPSIHRGGPMNLVGGSSWHIQFYNNVIDCSNVLRDYFFMFELMHARINIRDNYFIGDGAQVTGILCDGFNVITDEQYGSRTEGYDNVRINNNVFWKCGFNSGVLIFKDNYCPSSGVTYHYDTIQVWNNVIANSVSRGIQFFKYSRGTIKWDNFSIRNNIFLDGNTNVAQFEWQTSSDDLQYIEDTVITHNFFEDNGTDDVIGEEYTTNPTLNNNTDGAAELAESGNRPDLYYRAISSSACVDAGVDVGLPYYGSAPDIGRYEYQPPSLTIRRQR